MRDYDLCPTYMIRVRYWDGKWKHFTDTYSGYTLKEAIERCKYENAQEFDYKKGYIVEIFKETETTWEEIQYW